MKTKHLVLLLIAALLLIGLANWSGRRRQSPAASLTGTPLLPGFDVNAVAAVEISEGGQTLRLARIDSAWCVTNAYNYPADFQRLVQRLLALRDVKIGQVQRGMKLDEAGATLVKLYDSQGATLASLTLGPTRQARSDAGGMGYYRPSEGRYLSRNDDGQVFLVKESLEDWSTVTESWLDTQILGISADDIATIEMRPAAGGDDDAVVLDRTSGSLKLVGLDEEKEQFESGRASGVESALTYLRFNRIADPNLPEETLGFATGNLFRVTLKNGDIYNAALGAAAEGSRYFKVGVESGPPSTNATLRAEAEARVASANDRLGRWTFLIASYSADNMVRTRDELVSEKPAETNAPAASEPAAAEPAAAEPAAAVVTEPVAVPEAPAAAPAAEKAVDKPAAAPAAEATAEKPADKPAVEKPAAPAVEKPAEKPAEAPAEKPVVPAADKPADKPAEAPAAAPAA